MRSSVRTCEPYIRHVLLGGLCQRRDYSEERCKGAVSEQQQNDEVQYSTVRGQAHDFQAAEHKSHESYACCM